MAGQKFLLVARWSTRRQVPAGARFENGKLVERPTNREVISKPRDQGGHETGRHVVHGNFRVWFGCLTGSRAGTDSDMQGGPVDELLGVAVERPALDQLEVEVGRTMEDRAQPGLTGAYREMFGEPVKTAN